MTTAFPGGWSSILPGDFAQIKMNAAGGSDLQAGDPIIEEADLQTRQSRDEGR